MYVKCLKITFEDGEIAICKLLQKIGHATDVVKFKNNEHYTVYLFANEHLDVLRQYVEVVYDCGIKDPRHTCGGPKKLDNVLRCRSLTIQGDDHEQKEKAAQSRI